MAGRGADAPLRHPDEWGFLVKGEGLVNNDKGKEEGMTQSEIEQFKVKIKHDYVKLLDLLAQVIAANNYLSVDDFNDRERSLIARGLTNKFTNHALTVLYLSRGTNQDLPSVLFSLADFASIDVLTRASLEAFLTFHYVFYAPATKEGKNYQYWAYKAAGIAERQNVPASTEEFRQKLVADRKELNELREKLKSNAVFQSLTDNQRKRILRGEWRLKSWREIAIDAGFSEILASDMYKYLSGSAHSSFLSVDQAVKTQINKKEEEAISSSMGIMNAVIANMIREYCGLFSKAQDVLSKDCEGGYIVDWWIQVDRGLNEFANIGQDND